MEGPTNTLTKAFKIIEEIVSNQESGLTLKEVVERTEAPKSSSHRILTNLARLGYINRDQETGRYRGALKLASLGSEVLARFDLRVHMRPHLAALQKATGLTCNLAIRSGHVGIYIDRFESPLYGIRLFSNVGQTFPLHGGGLGKAMLAYTDSEELDEILSYPMEKFTPNTVTDPAELKLELERIRKRGYAMDDEEVIRGVKCIAAAILGPGGRCVGAISATFPAYAAEERDTERDIQALKWCADAGQLIQGA
jgi:IclR family acetate operon transcriptional repressor